PLFPRVGRVQFITTTQVGDPVQVLTTSWQLLPGKAVQQNTGTRVQFPAGGADFRDLIQVELSATPGDRISSGAPVLSATQKLVGMAYDTSGNSVFVVPIQRIMDELKIERLATDAG